MTPEEQEVILNHQVWTALLWFSIIAFICILIVPTKEMDENGEELDLDNEEHLARRRKSMDCYGRHEWITTMEGLRKCKICNYEYKENDE